MLYKRKKVKFIPKLTCAFVSIADLWSSISISHNVCQNKTIPKAWKTTMKLYFLSISCCQKTIHLHLKHLVQWMYIAFQKRRNMIPVFKILFARCQIGQVCPFALWQDLYLIGYHYFDCMLHPVQILQHKNTRTYKFLQVSLFTMVLFCSKYAKIW